MSEWFKEPVLKTGDSSRAVGSNPTLSATFFRTNQIPQEHLQPCRSTQVAIRGSPAKGVVGLNRARVRIPPSAPKRKATARAVAFRFGFRPPEAASTLRNFNAQGGEAAHLRPQSLHSKDCGVCVSMKSAPTLEGGFFIVSLETESASIFSRTARRGPPESEPRFPRRYWGR